MTPVLILLFLITSPLFTTEAVDILGGSPLSSSAPPFNPQIHPKPPSGFWGSQSGPYETNTWWQNLVLDNGDQQVNVLPFLVKTLDDGLHVCLPGKVFFYFLQFLDRKGL